MAEDTSVSVEQQLSALEQQIQERRAEADKDSSAPYEREEVHHAVGEQIDEITQAPASDAPTATPPPASAQDTAELQRLVNIAFTTGVQAAVKEARKTGNAALIDALHDILTDEFHQQLIDRQKLPVMGE